MSSMTWGTFSYSQWVGACEEPCPHCVTVVNGVILTPVNDLTPMRISFLQYGSRDEWPNYWLDFGGEG